MPEISRFFGIVIRIFFNDHAPPHFHAVYGGDEALIEIESLTVYRGELPQRALAMVLEWAALHRQELRRDWDLARRGRPPEPIAPLE
ncbi:MAG: transcriptional regulator [Deltaproteobacteria bacterium RIFCSPLOWO2_02_56_12]|nr:MAG: transcriptional regulator [Deltaproteobacteria bacterium RIFCSPLOWO2_02_56_12]